MPQVPYNPVPDVQPDVGMTPRVGVSTPPAAFGENIGAALSHLGATFDQVGGELWNRAVALQELEQERQARDATTNFMVEQGTALEKYRSMEGVNAVQAQQQFLEESKALREKYRATLQSPYAQRQFDSESQNFLARNIISSSQWAAEQNKNSISTSLKSRRDADDAELLGNPDVDDATFNQKLRDRVRSVQEEGSIRGWTPEVTKQKADAELAKAWSSRIVGVAQNRPMEGEKLFEANKDKLGVELKRTETEVRGYLYTQGARNIGDQVNADLSHKGQEDTTKSLNERLAEGRKAAEAIAPGDPSFKDHVDSAVVKGYNTFKAGQRSFEFDNRQFVSGAINGSYGKVATSEDDLRADPKVWAAWKNLPETAKTAYLRDMARNAKGDVGWSVPGLERSNYIRGLRVDRMDEFLDMDMAHEEKLPFSERLALQKLQQSDLQGPKGNMQVAGYINTLGNLVPADIRQDKDKFTTYKGMFAREVEDFFAQHHKAPNPEERREINKGLLQQIPSESQSWFGKLGSKLFGEATERTFEATPPQQYIEQYKKRVNPNASDEEIKQEFSRTQYQKYHGSSTKPDKPSGIEQLY